MGILGANVCEVLGAVTDARGDAVSAAIIVVDKSATMADTEKGR